VVLAANDLLSSTSAAVNDVGVTALGHDPVLNHRERPWAFPSAEAQALVLFRARGQGRVPADCARLRQRSFWQSPADACSS